MSLPSTNQNSHLQLRISVDEIENAVHQLQSAFAKGQIDDREYENRIAQALIAKTKGELAALCDDLLSPSSSGSQLQPVGKRAWAVLSGCEQKGEFLLPKKYQVVAVLGGCVLDLRRVILEDKITNIKVTAVLGGVQIIVPEGFRVMVHGLPILGGFAHDASGEEPSPHAPVINIRGLAILGGVEIKTSK